MSARKNLITTAVIALTTLGFVTTAGQLLEVKTPDDARSYQQEQQAENGSDADEHSKDQQRNAGDDHANAEQAQKNIPGEHRAPEPRVPEPRVRPKIRIRLP